MNLIIRDVLPGRHRDARYRWTALPKSSVSEMLNCKRKKTPPLDRLRTFVLACEWYAWRNGVLQQYATTELRSGPPVLDQVMDYWLRRRTEVDRALQARKKNGAHDTGAAPATRIPPGPAPAITGDGAGSSPDPARPKPYHLEPKPPPAQTMSPESVFALIPDVVPSPGSGGPVLPTLEELAKIARQDADLKLDSPGPAAIRLTTARTTVPRPAIGAGWSTSQARMYGIFGLAGVELYNRAENDDFDAAYRLGVLLCTDGRLAEAEYYLDKASQNRNGDATSLLKTAPHKRRHQAMTYARVLGQEAASEADLPNAIMYLTAAARCDDSLAALQLATLLRPGQSDKADHWLHEATDAHNIRAIAPFAASGRRRAAPEENDQACTATQPIDMCQLMRAQDGIDGMQDAG
ncbi:hypothetical protein [Actinocorallia populi]|uniref:hypothetical protein n=1 Tax=Actinocorallia populi TaxID=2079200 RepID=UPI000D0954BE|nr:hypothetical protein [Actinocorallia populi]